MALGASGLTEQLCGAVPAERGDRAAEAGSAVRSARSTTDAARTGGYRYYGVGFPGVAAAAGRAGDRARSGGPRAAVPVRRGAAQRAALVHAGRRPG